MQLPKNSTIFKNIERDTDNRGGILSIVDAKVENVSIIQCNKNTIRSNHYHKRDFHFMYVLEGKINYFFKGLDSKDFYYIKVLKGQTIFTPKQEIHATHFPVETCLIVSSGFPRDQKTYENDTERVDFVNQYNLSEMIRTGKKC
jgi:oxalate decarboxylase/phosphoglucose isomerase-like protein (cupin superfamily)